MYLPIMSQTLTTTTRVQPLYIAHSATYINVQLTRNVLVRRPTRPSTAVSSDLTVGGYSGVGKTRSYSIIHTSTLYPDLITLG